MKNINSKNLVERIKRDTFYTKLMAGAITCVSLIFLVRFIATIVSGNYAQNDLQGDASNFVRAGCGTAAFVMLSIILSEICRTGKPFTKGIEKKLKSIAWVLVFSPLAAIFANTAAAFIDPTATGTQRDITTVDLLIMIFAVVIGIISEIFHYGVNLEEDMDSIA